MGYLPNESRFDAFFPNSLFINQNYLKTSPFFPLAFQPFGYPQGKNFVYAYSQQINLSFEQDLGSGFALSLAYNYNGEIFVSDEGRMVDHQGDPIFKVGSVQESSWQQVLDHPTTKACAQASTLDNQPMCQQCAYKAFCGVDAPGFVNGVLGAILRSVRDNGAGHG